MQKQIEKEIESALSELVDADAGFPFLRGLQILGSPISLEVIDDDGGVWYSRVDVGSLPEGVLGAVRFLDSKNEALILISDSITDPTAVKGILFHEVAHVLRGPSHSEDDEILFRRARALASECLECGDPAIPVTPDELRSFLEGGSL